MISGSSVAKIASLTRSSTAASTAASTADGKKHTSESQHMDCVYSRNIILSVVVH